MPPPQRDTSFQNFLKEFFDAPENLPPTLINKVYALYEKNKRRTLTSVEVESSIRSKKGGNTSLISTFVAGGEEALLDVKGVNTTVDLSKLINDPVATLNALGKTTLKDITKFDEQASDKRSDVVEGLTTGDLKKRGRVLIEPGNLALSSLAKMGFPLVDKSDVVETNAMGETESRIRLLGSSLGRLNPRPVPPPGRRDPDAREDRQILEQGKDRESRYKAYRDLAGNLTGLASYMESTPARINYYRETVVSYNRSVISELGVNLDDVLPIKGRRKYDPGTGRAIPADSKGAFWQTLEDQHTAGFTNVNSALNDLLANDTKLRKALGLDDVTNDYQNKIWNNLDTQSKDYAREFLRSEFAEQGLFEGKDPFERKVNIGGRMADKNPLDIFGKTALELEVEGNSLLADMVRASPDGKPSLYKTGLINREKNKRALEAHVKTRLAEGNLTSKISEAARIHAYQREFDSASAALASLGIAGGPVTNIADPRLSLISPTKSTEIVNLAQEAGIEARKRLLSATTASRIANNLFFAATTKELLENIEEGKFLETVLLTSKILGTLPFTSTKWGTASEYVAYVDRFGIGKATSVIVGAQKTAVKWTGLVFEEDESGLTGIAKHIKGPFRSEAYVGWNKEVINPVTGESKIFWTQAAVKPGTAGGVFEKWGLHDVLKGSWGENGDLFKKFGFADPEHYNPTNLLTNLDDAENFMRELHSAGTRIVGGIVPVTDIEKMAEAMGLNIADNLNFLNTNITRFTALDGNGGKQFLEFLSDPALHPGGFPLDPSRRWDFLLRVVKENKVDQILKPFTGLLNRYNRAANAIYTFLYREMLWGGYAGNNFLIKAASGMLAPFRPILQGIGFADETLLSGAVQKWGFVKWFNSIGNKFYALGNNPAVATSMTSKFLTSFLGPTVLKSLGFLASGAGGVITGGLSYVLAAFGGIAWNFSKQILQGNFAQAFSSSGKMLREKIRTINKLVGGVILGILSCILLPFIFIAGIVAMLSPLEPATGGGAYADVIGSRMIAVTKTATEVSNGIEYKISIKNTTDTTIDPTTNQPNPIPVNISGFADTLRYAISCKDGGGIVEVTTNAAYGTVTLPQIGDLPSTTIQPGDTLEVPPFIISNISREDGTYLNSVEVTITEDPGKKGEASASNKFGLGGCAVCPAGWPTQPFVLTQSAYTYDSHKNAEALDMAGATGQNIYATHNGTIYRGDDPSGYGNYVKVISPMGFSTIYAHMSAILVSSGQEITAEDVAGKLVIGKMGNSGNSTGPHLHYEFVNRSVECLGPGKPLRMRRYSDTPEPGSYIPETVPARCVGSASCNMSR